MHWALPARCRLHQAGLLASTSNLMCVSNADAAPFAFPKAYAMCSFCRQTGICHFEHIHEAGVSANILGCMTAQQACPFCLRQGSCCVCRCSCCVCGCGRQRGTRHFQHMHNFTRQSVCQEASQAWGTPHNVDCTLMLSDSPSGSQELGTLSICTTSPSCFIGKHLRPGAL